MNVLFLTIKKYWFDKILSGEKTIEYREYKEYYHRKLKKNYDKILLQAGYSKVSPRLIADIKMIDVGYLKNENELFPTEEKCYKIHLENAVILKNNKTE